MAAFLTDILCLLTNLKTLVKGGGIKSVMVACCLGNGPENKFSKIITFEIFQENVMKPHSVTLSISKQLQNNMFIFERPVLPQCRNCTRAKSSSQDDSTASAFFNNTLIRVLVENCRLKTSWSYLIAC